MRLPFATLLSVAVLLSLIVGSADATRPSGDDRASATAATTDVPAAARCTRRGAKRAARQARFDRQIRRRMPRFVGPRLRVFELFQVGKVFCRDMTGDGRRERVVEFLCCTVSSPRPWAILQRRRGRWRIGFSRVRTLHFGFDTAVFEFAQGMFWAVEEEIPVYRRGDSNCCPSSFRYRYTRWDRGRRAFRVDNT
jgi:hypothetical protein